MWEEIVMLENWKKSKTTYHISLCIAISAVGNTHVKRVMSRGLGRMRFGEVVVSPEPRI